MDVAGKVGIGFRRDFASEFLKSDVLQPGFVEFAPENWIGMGGFWKKKLDAIVEKYPVLCHSLSMSIGSPDKLDMNYLQDIKDFLEMVDCKMYSFHLSFAKCDNAHLYELLPIPFTEDAIKHVSEKIKIVQDFLDRPVAIENSSYYTAVEPEMEEIQFVNAVIKESGCKMLLDVNNVYVNAFNHKYNAEEYINQLDLDQVMYIHMAGHTQVNEDTIIDTHGEPIIDPVYDLFEFAIKKLPPVPVLLERDFNIPKLAELQGEVSALQGIVNKVWSPVKQ